LSAFDVASPRQRWRATARGLAIALVAAFIVGFAAIARAGPVLDRVKAFGVVHCGAVARPGLLAPTPDGADAGLLVDLCRAIGVAAAGASVKTSVDVYDSDAAFDAVRRGRDDVFFLSGAEIVDQKLAGVLVPGPPVFHETTALMVAGDSKVERPADLAGRSICFLQGDVSHRQLEAYFAARQLSFQRMGYQEEDELHDAFDARQCQAWAAEVTTLAEVRREGGPRLRSGRILSEPLASFPIIAATGASDGAWSALVFWTIATLIDADRPYLNWAAGGLDSLPFAAAPIGTDVPGTSVGSAAGWREAVLAATGSYQAMFRRNLGAGSPLGIPAGPNTLPADGGLLTPPYAE
jgi:general L-amino acid transport system substrate-binding protein